MPDDRVLIMIGRALLPLRAGVLAALVLVPLAGSPALAVDVQPAKPAPAPDVPVPPGESPAASMARPTGDLGGTSWKLVRFQGGDDTILTPDDGSKYTLTFDPGGGVSVRLDCNRGRGMWKSPVPNQLQLGPLALTRASCPPGSLHDRMAKDWGYIRSYTLRNGHLFLSLQADAGTYEFAPTSLPGPELVPKTPPTSTRPSSPAAGPSHPPASPATNAGPTSRSRVEIGEGREPGERLVFGGRVLDYRGLPLSNAAVVAYHTDRTGLYNPPGSPSRVPRLRAVAVTDPEGRFEFATIRPAAYPEGTQPAHIHMLVAAPAHHVRHLEYWFRGDSLIPASARIDDGDDVRVIVELAKNADGTWTFHHDIQLQPN